MLLLNGGSWEGGGNPSTEPPSSTPTSPAPTETPSDDPTDSPSVAPTCTATLRLASTLYIMGLDREDVRLGNEVDWSLIPEDQPRAAFSLSEVRTRANLRHLLNSSQAARAFLADLSARDHQRALAGRGFVPIQPKQSIRLRGNNQLVSGQSVRRASTSKVGEVFWVFIPSKTCDVTMVIGFRTWCGNPVFWLASWTRE